MVGAEREAEETPELQTQQERAVAVQFRARQPGRAHTASSPSRGSLRAPAAAAAGPSSSVLSPELFLCWRLELSGSFLFRSPCLSFFLLPCCPPPNIFLFP